MKQALFLAILISSAYLTQKIQLQSQVIKTASTIQQNRVTMNRIEPSRLISKTGIGKAKLGMTLGELKQISDRDTKFELISPFMTDSKAIAVSQGGLTQYYILYPLGTTSHPDKSTPTDDDPITSLMTDNYNYQTLEGVKVGTSIQDAEEIYGNAVIAYNQHGESREYITFAKNNASNVHFRASYFKLISDGLGFSGIYPEYPGVASTTNKYQADAAIAAIEVTCTQEIVPTCNPSLE